MGQNNHHALLFEAKSIQQYLFSSGRLRDIIGASELVDTLTGSLLDKSLRTLDLTEDKDIHFSRRAGGAFYAFSKNGSILEKLRSLYSLLVQQCAPDLAFDMGLGHGENYLEAFDDARVKLRQDTAHLRPSLPVSAPVVERSRRTGRTAITYDRRDGPVDAATQAKKAYANPSQAEFIGNFTPEKSRLAWRDWPRNLESNQDDKDSGFPFEQDDRTIALIHADGNGLGQILRNVHAAVSNQPDKFISVFKALSKVFSDTTTYAARKAVADVLLPARGDGLIPARPVLLGGDDLTIIVRADLAFDFINTFVSAFESYSPETMQSLRDQGVEGLPERLTIGAGIVFMRSSQPFYLASHLAESLMATAKKQSRTVNHQPASSLAFHRVTGSLAVEHESIIKHELTHEHNGVRYVDTLGSYFIGEHAHTPKLEDLQALSHLLSTKDMARGPTRQLLTLIGLSSADAKTRYRRWRDLMKEHRKSTLQKFDQLLIDLLGGEPEKDLPYRLMKENFMQGPIADALSIRVKTSEPSSQKRKDAA